MKVKKYSNASWYINSNHHTTKSVNDTLLSGLLKLTSSTTLKIANSTYNDFSSFRPGSRNVQFLPPDNNSCPSTGGGQYIIINEMPTNTQSLSSVQEREITGLLSYSSGSEMPAFRFNGIYQSRNARLLAYLFKYCLKETERAKFCSESILALVVRNI